MEVHIHAHHGHLPAENVENLNARVEKGLVQFDSRLTRVEVFFKDTNGPKGGVDCHCSVEARPRGLKPVAVTHEAEQIGDALDGALHKLEHALEHRFGKLESRKHAD